MVFRAHRKYFFTATPKHSLTVFKPGMNDPEIYGQVICNVPATKLVDEGYILPPKVVIKELALVMRNSLIVRICWTPLMTTLSTKS